MLLLALGGLLRLVKRRVRGRQLPSTSRSFVNRSETSIQGLADLIVLLLLERGDALMTTVVLRTLCRRSDVIMSLLLLLLLVLAARSTSCAQWCGRLPGQLRLLILVRGSVTVRGTSDVRVTSCSVLLVVARSILVLAIVPVVAVVVVVLILLAIVSIVHDFADAICGLSLATSFEHARRARGRGGLVRVAASQGHGVLRAHGWLLVPVVINGDAVADELGPVEFILLAECTAEEVYNGTRGLAVGKWKGSRGTHSQQWRRGRPRQ